MNDNELLELLKRDVDKFNQYRKDNPEQKIDFRGADLEDTNLKKADLKEVDLRDANLKFADLRDANLQSADARGANFSWSCLARTNIELMKIYPNQRCEIIVSLGLLEYENE